MKVLSSLLQRLIIVHRFHQRPSPFPNELGQFLFSQSVEILLATREVPAGRSTVYHSSLVCRSYCLTPRHREKKKKKNKATYNVGICDLPSPKKRLPSYLRLCPSKESDILDLSVLLLLLWNVYAFMIMRVKFYRLSPMHTVSSSYLRSSNCYYIL